MNPSVVTKDPAAVAAEVQAAYLAMFSDADPMFVSRVFGWTNECFVGRYADYQPVDTRYHDFEHTLQGTLCMSRLLRNRHTAAAQPRLTRRIVELGVIAILLHDTGYLKKRGDTEGTGAKYTVTHVARSAEFAAALLSAKGYTASDIQAVKNMIRCTGIDTLPNVIPFQDELEKTVGCALGTADLLGQMAAPDYVDKLPVLFAEFEEANHNAGDGFHYTGMFTSADDLLQKTPAFWENYVQVKLNAEFAGLYKFLNSPYPDGPNPYVQSIEANMERIRRRLATAKS